MMTSPTDEYKVPSVIFSVSVQKTAVVLFGTDAVISPMLEITQEIPVFAAHTTLLPDSTARRTA